MPIRDLIASWTFRLGMATAGRRAYNRLLDAAGDPRAAQANTLLNILASLASTEIGRRYGYGTIKDADAFRTAVPIHDYEALRPFIDRQIATGEPVITAARPVMYARTSGTTGHPKLVPVTAEVVTGLREAQRAMAYVQHTALKAFRGHVLAIAGALREETLPDGTPAGATTGLIYRTMPRIIRAKYVLPAEVFAIEDYDLRYAVVARLALQYRDLSVIATANPSTILRLMHQIEADAPALIEDLADGSSRLLTRLPPEIAVEVKGSLRAAPAQARALKNWRRRGTPLALGDAWPQLRSVMTWLGAGCAVAADAVRKSLPAGAGMIDAGYVASEVRGTVVVDAASNLALPVVEDVFFEFAPIEAWDAGDRSTRLLHEIEVGQAYSILVTTFGGLARYHMNDIVRVTGRIGGTPTLAFVRKGRGVTNITGEKLTEDQVNIAVADVAGAAGLRVPFYVLVADPVAAGYRAFVETDATEAQQVEAIGPALDKRLGALNIEYASKQASGRLKPVAVVALAPGAERAYRQHCVRKGQREAQFKVLTLQNASEFNFDVNPHRLGAVIGDANHASARG